MSKQETGCRMLSAQLEDANFIYKTATLRREKLTMSEDVEIMAGKILTLTAEILTSTGGLVTLMAAIQTVAGAELDFCGGKANF